MTRAARSGLLLLAVTACIIALYRWSWRPIQCSLAATELTRRTALANETRGDYERTIRARKNLQDLASQRSQCAHDVRFPMLAAANLEVLGNLGGAAGEYKVALKAQQRPEIYLALANTEIQMGRIDAASAHFELLARFHPIFLEVTSEEQLRDRIRTAIRNARQDRDAY